MAIKGSEWKTGAITPHVVVRDLDAALAFYKDALGAVELYRSPFSEEFGEYASVRIWDSIVMLSTDLEHPSPEKPELAFAASPERLGGTTCVFQVSVPDPDRVYQRAIDSGALPAMPLADRFWGDRYGWLRDPFGHLWAICSINEILEPEQVNQRMVEAR